MAYQRKTKSRDKEIKKFKAFIEYSSTIYDSYVNLED